VHFVGGAGFGSAPQLVYDELLSTIAERCGVVVIATPFDVSFDHWKLSAATGEEFERALSECQATLGLSGSAPIYRVGHSLGAKLLVLGALRAERKALRLGAAAEALANDEAAPAPPPPASNGRGKLSLGLICFNNFDLGDSAKLAASFVANAQGGARGEATARTVLEAFGLLQQVARATGTAVDVSPTPAELEDEVGLWFGGGAAASPDLRIWRFDGDELDSSAGLVEALPEEAAVAAAVSVLDGGHLSPVYFRLDPSELDPALGMLLGGMGGSGFAVGSAEALAPLCDELCAWIWPSAMKAPTLLEAEGADEVEPPE